MTLMQNVYAHSSTVISSSSAITMNGHRQE